MFEQVRGDEKPNRGFLWTAVPLAALAFAAVIGFFVYFGFTKPTNPEPLTGVLRAGDPNFEWYKKYVSIDPKSQKIQLAQNMAGARIVTFSGVIKNGGEKTLDVVEVKLGLFNYLKPVWEGVRTPIRPDDRIPPLGPLEERPFSLYVEALPEAWNAGQAEMWISGFRFAKPER
jgi:hypothetical protein